MSDSTTPHTLRVLHLSDLHERVAPDPQNKARTAKVRAHKAKQARVLGDKLMDQLDRIRREGELDLLFFTGDLADWGLVGEYELARTRLGKIVERVGLTWKQVFFVPGNHDVDRSKMPAPHAQLRGFAAENPEKVGGVMAGFSRPLGAPEERGELIAARQAAYRDFLVRIGRPELLPDPDGGHASLGYRQQVQVRDLPPVHIIGLDTAWLAGGDDDAGKLRLTDEQIDIHTTDEANGEPLDGLRLALMHHPLSDLADGDDARRLLAGVVDLVTHGHKHKPSLTEVVDADRSLTILAAGCLYEGDAGDRWVNRLHVLNVQMNERGRPLQYVVEFFAWSPEGYWHADPSLYENASGGRLVLKTPLGKAQPPVAPAASQRLTPPAALDRFVGREAQLAKMRAALISELGEKPGGVCCVHGMAGVGKSLLADRFFQLHADSFSEDPLKRTLAHDELPTDDGLLRDLAEQLGVRLSPGDLAPQVLMALKAQRRLVHIDNIDTQAQADAVSALVDRLRGARLLLTGRHVLDAHTHRWCDVAVEPFETDEALQQLDRELGEARASQEPMADKRRLVDVLEGLPLAICLAASYLRPVRSIDSFLSTHQRLLSIEAKRAPNKLYWDQSRKELRALSATFKISLDALRVALGDDAPRGLPAVCAAGVAPLVGVRIGWLAAIMGVEKADAEGWLSDALTLSIVQHDAKTGRWRVHKLLGEHLRGHTDVEAAIARMDAWVLERLPGTQDETRGARWGALQGEHDAVAEWVTGLNGERAVMGGIVGFDYSLVSGPYAAWLGAVARGLAATTNAKARSALLWCRGNLAQQVGELDLALQAAKDKAKHDADQGWDREVAIAAVLCADVLQTRGQTDEALHIRRNEALPVFERLGDEHSKANTMDVIADVLQARGEIDEALRIRVEEVLPVFEQLGDLWARANTMSKIADVLKARGQLDEALRLQRDQVLPVYERFSDVRSKAITLSKIADLHKDRGQLDDALRLWREEVLPAFDQLGNVREKAVAMGKIADVLETRGKLDDALRIRWEEEIPVYERLGDVRERAVTMSKIADVLQVRGQIDEALKIRREQVLPALETVGDQRELCVGRANLAITLLLTRKPEHIPEALTLLTTALKSAVELLLPVEVEWIRGVFHQLGLTPPH